jgi:hypothetical protein
MTPALLILVAVIFSAWFVNETGGYRETMTVGGLAKGRIQSECETQKLKMRRQIIRFLERCGCDPREDGDYIVFIYQGNTLWIHVYEDGAYTRFGAYFRNDDTERWLLLESINRVNASVLFAKANIDEKGGLNVEVHCKALAVKTLKKDFHIYCGAILHTAQEVGNTCRKIMEDTKQEKTIQNAIYIN